MRILVAEDDPVSLRALEATLVKWGHEVVVARCGAEAFRLMQQSDAPPLAILDWMMPEMDGVEICRRVRRAALPTYIILLTAKSGKDDEITGLEAGADDYLTKPFDRSELRARLQAGTRIVELQNRLAERVRELEAAIIERRRAEESLRNLTLTDDLTTLYNRRGFFAFTEQHLKMARRMRKHASLIYADMDGLKKINDTYGHNEGSLAITKVAEILRQTFRESDIIARLGGDEFTVLAADICPEKTNVAAKRLEENLADYNARGNHQYDLSLSFGIINIDPDNKLSVEELIAKADAAMYEHKRGRRSRAQMVEV